MTKKTAHEYIPDAVRSFLSSIGSRGGVGRAKALSPARRLEISQLGNAAKSANLEAKKKREKDLDG
jgi:hypothetical protein